MILPRIRDPRLITIRRGGTLTDADHHLLALWAARCAEHVLHLFESAVPCDPRPRRAIEQVRGWVRGEVRMMQARAAGGAANSAARPLSGAPRYAAYAAGQAAVVAHVAAHELGAAAYAIRAVRAAAPAGAGEAAGRRECRWQRDQLPERIHDLVLDDQRLRNAICWSVFEQNHEPGTRRGEMLRGVATVTLWADDVRAARDWYAELLGIEPYFARPDRDHPAYVEFRLGDYQHELGIIDRSYAPRAAPSSPGGVIAYWHVDDIEAALQRTLSLGATEYEPLTARGEGFVTASVTDPFGNILGLMYNPHYLEILGARENA